MAGRTLGLKELGISQLRQQEIHSLTERPFLLKLRTEFGRPLSVCFVPIL
jgi:hypothetical protein